MSLSVPMTREMWDIHRTTPKNANNEIRPENVCCRFETHEKSNKNNGRMLRNAGASQASRVYLSPSNESILPNTEELSCAAIFRSSFRVPGPIHQSAEFQKLLHNLALKGHGFSRAAKSRENPGL